MAAGTTNIGFEEKLWQAADSYALIWMRQNINM